jgi:hypothetical protein
VFNRQDQAHCVEVLANSIEARGAKFIALFSRAVHIWYDCDIVEEDIIIEWNDMAKHVPKYERLVKNVTFSLLIPTIRSNHSLIGSTKLTPSQIKAF